MDISRINALQQIAPVNSYKNPARVKGYSGAARQGADEVNVSANGKVFAAAMRHIADTPDVREDKIAALRSQIESGTYRPDARAIAAKMLGAVRA